MRFSQSAWALLPLLSLVSGAVLQAQVDETSAILTDLAQVKANSTALNTTVAGVADDGTYNFFQLLTISKQTTNVTDSLNATSAAANASSTFTVADAKKITSAVNMLTPVTISVLNNIVAHKPAFQNSNVTSVVQQNLETQRGIVAELGTTFEKKAPNEKYKKLSAKDTKQQLAHFDAAIKAFS